MIEHGGIQHPPEFDDYPIPTLEAALRSGRVDPDDCDAAEAAATKAVLRSAESALPIDLLFRGWSPATHQLHHTGVRAAARALLLVARRLSSEAELAIEISVVLPTEMWLKVLSFVSRRHFAVPADIGAIEAIGHKYSEWADSQRQRWR